MKSVAVVVCSYVINPLLLVKKVKDIAAKNSFVIEGVVVDNKGFAVSNIKGFDVILGSNDALDFSAYFEGAQYLIKRNGKIPEVILFINDSTFTSHYGGVNISLAFQNLALLTSIRLPSMLGKCDTYETICHKSPWSGIGKYISSYCFALNTAGVDVLLKLDNFSEIDGAGKKNQVDDEEWGLGLNSQFKEFVLSLIKHKNSPYLWHGFRVESSNPTLSTKKARCIYFEHRLSGEIGKIGCLIPINPGKRTKLLILVADLFSGYLRKLGMLV